MTYNTLNEKLRINAIKMSDLSYDINIKKSDLNTFDIVKFGCSAMLYMVFINDDIMKFYSVFHKNSSSVYKYKNGVFFYMSDSKLISGRHQQYLIDYDENLRYVYPTFTNWNVIEIYKKPENITLYNNNEKPLIDTLDTTQENLENIIKTFKYKLIKIENSQYNRL